MSTKRVIFSSVRDTALKATFPRKIILLFISLLYVAQKEKNCI